MRWRRGRAYSQDLRDRVFAAADDGAQVGEAAEMLQVSVIPLRMALCCPHAVRLGICVKR